MRLYKPYVHKDEELRRTTTTVYFDTPDGLRHRVGYVSTRKDIVSDKRIIEVNYGGRRTLAQGFEQRIMSLQFIEALAEGFDLLKNEAKWAHIEVNTLEASEK